MRLLIYTAAIAVVLFAYGWRIEQMQDEVRANHAALDARIEQLGWEITELSCVHYIYEDGSAVHLDAETAIGCLNFRLGWPRP